MARGDGFGMEVLKKQTRAGLLFSEYTPDMQHDSSDRGLSYPIGMTSPALPTLSCPFTKMQIGDGTDEAQRYAETVSARLELAIEALEALGAVNRLQVMRVWLERWLRIVEILFEERLEQRHNVFSTQA
jgi:hypothetical protein